jgi:cytoskeletal protein CcmA (bactofilin family)
MFRRKNAPPGPAITPAAASERITSVLGAGVIWKGQMSGTGGVRIEGAFDGDIALRGLLVVGETGRVTAREIRANLVIIAGAVRGDITAEKVEIRSTGRVWGNVVTAAFATEEGAFLRGQITMEEQVDIGLPPISEPEESPEASVAAADEQGIAGG